MIIFGEKLLKREIHSTNEPCPSCGKAHLQVQRFAKFRHVYWIPIFPLGNRAALFCGHCQWTCFDQDLKKADPYRQLIQAFVPLNAWKFLATYGALAVLVVGGLVVHGESRSLEREAAISSFYAKPSPATLIVKESNTEYPYRIIKVTSVEDDRLIVQLGQNLYKNELGAVRDAEALSTSEEKSLTREFYEVSKQEVAKLSVVRVIENPNR